MATTAALTPTVGGRSVELRVYIAWDSGDPFYDAQGRRAQIEKWIEEHVATPLSHANVWLRVALLSYLNKMGKPGPAFNFLMRAAFEDGADYLCRVNDDTRFVTPWVAPSIELLLGFQPPNLGVVGPICNEGNTKILTHDFVHRTHLEIFDFYYPPILCDWWMDDWITRVYGAHRMRKGPWMVQHLVNIHGTRYEVDFSHGNRLDAELRFGEQLIAQWLQINKSR
mmetsp:Transcript_32675/g.81336  ORF Transcript_32675/g.81336 Transcript_32675/m.81336 type:complete len:225 (+) Transcript_32675:2-676(+)